MFSKGHSASVCKIYILISILECNYSFNIDHCNVIWYIWWPWYIIELRTFQRHFLRISNFLKLTKMLETPENCTFKNFYFMVHFRFLSILVAFLVSELLEKEYIFPNFYLLAKYKSVIIFYGSRYDEDFSLIEGFNKIVQNSEPQTICNTFYWNCLISQSSYKKTFFLP